MSHSTFAERYDCQIQFQYIFDGKNKQHYPIISHLRQEGSFLDLTEFNEYPIITILESTLDGCTIYLERIRDLNFQQCSIKNLNIQAEQFGGTLNFAQSSVSLEFLKVSTSPNIMAFVGCELQHIAESRLTGFSELHTLALLDVGLDFLDLNPIISQIHLKQLILTELQESVPLRFDIPPSLTSMRLKHTTLHDFPVFPNDSELEILFIEEVQFIKYSTEMLQQLANLQCLEELTIKNSDISHIPYLNLENLKDLILDQTITIDSKMIAKLRIQDVEITRL